MSKDNLSTKILNTIEGYYKPKENELDKLARIAKLNKLYLVFLRSIRGINSSIVQHELLIEETRFRST